MSSDQPILSGAPLVHVQQAEATRRRASLRTHLLEIVLFAAALSLLVATGVAVVFAALDARTPAADLSFSGTVEELELVLSNRGPDRLARLDEATITVAGRRIVVDTIAILADPEDEPAAAPGGFIADQVARFNDHAIRQAVLRATLADAAVPATTVPSLLRTARAEDGERRLSERVNPFVLTVRSPYAERTWRAVHTSDWTRSATLLGLAGDVALSRRIPDGAHAQLNGNDCTIRRDTRKFLLYCGSTLASDVGRFYDIGFTLNDAGSAFSPAQAFVYRPASLWRNGRNLDFTTDEVRAGEVFDVRRTGAFLLSASEHGTLAAGQWINGRQTFANQRLGTISFFAAAGRTGEGVPDAMPIVLSLDATLSQDLDAEARRFLDAHPALHRMSVVLLDAHTGAVRAIAEPARRSGAEPLLAFEPLLVGSVAKPLVASAILARQPSLGSLQVHWAGDTVRAVANLPLDNGFANSANGCAGGIAFQDFIRCSSNQYAAELLVRSLRLDGFEPHDAERIAGGQILVPRDVLERSAIGAGLAEAFDVDAFGFRTAGRSPGLWTAVVGSGGIGGDATGGATRNITTTDRTLMPWESRPWLVFPETDGTPLDLLARYAFGGWENRWTLLGLGEAYARIATGRAVHARIIDDPTPADEVPANVATAFRRVRTALRSVPIAGTAAGLTGVLREATDNDVVVLAKTGTLNERRDRFRSLAVVVGKAGTAQGSAQESPQESAQPSAQSSNPASAPITCGLVATMWFDFHDDARRRAGSLAPVHLEFARSGLADVLQRHWNRLSGCAEPAASDEARDSIGGVSRDPARSPPRDAAATGETP